MNETAFATEKQKYDAAIQLIKAEGGWLFSSVMEKVQLTAVKANRMFWSMVAEGIIELHANEQCLHLITEKGKNS